MTAARLAAHQFRFDQKVFWRNPASVFFTVALPLIFLGSFGGRLAQRVGPFRLGPLGLMLGAGFMFSYGFVPTGGLPSAAAAETYVFGEADAGRTVRVTRGDAFRIQDRRLGSGHEVEVVFPAVDDVVAEEDLREAGAVDADARVAGG